MFKGHVYVLHAACLIILIIASCKKAPKEKDYLSDKANFANITLYQPILGRTVLTKTSFNPDGSSFPLTFSLENLRRYDGAAAPELSQPTPVLEWTSVYTGLEKSLQEIEAKRSTTSKPFFEIRAGSGDFIFYNANASLIQAHPTEGYLFDVKVANKGNERTIKNIRLRPVLPIAYEPFEYDSYTRIRKIETRLTSTGKSYKAVFVNHATMSNVYMTRDSIMDDTLSRVYFKKTGNGNSLTFKFFDKDSTVIDPAAFNLTKWRELVHGFNMQMTSAYVRYEVAYPIPLTDLNTAYAVSGKARVNIGYTRTGFDSKRLDANLRLNFGIYEKGDWEVIFKFTRTPRFQNE